MTNFLNKTWHNLSEKVFDDKSHEDLFSDWNKIINIDNYVFFEKKSEIENKKWKLVELEKASPKGRDIVTIFFDKNTTNEDLWPLIKQLRETIESWDNDTDILEELKLNLKLVLGKLYILQNKIKDLRDFRECVFYINKYQKIYKEIFGSLDEVKKENLYDVTVEELTTRNEQNIKNEWKKKRKKLIDDIENDENSENLKQYDSLISEELEKTLYELPFEKGKKEILEKLELPKEESEEFNLIQKKLKEAIKIDSLKKELEEARKTGNKEFLEQIQYNAILSIKEQLVKFPYISNIDSISDLFVNKKAICIIQALMVHVFLEELWINHYMASINNHVANIVSIWKQEYFFDTTNNILESITEKDKEYKWKRVYISKLDDWQNKFSYIPWEPDKVIISSILTNRWIDEIYKLANNSIIKEDSEYIQKIIDLSLSFFPENENTYLTAWRLNIYQRNIYDAIANFEKWLKINPEDGNLLTELWNCYKLKKDLENTRKYYEKAVLTQNTGSKCLNDIIAFYISQKDDKKAKEYIDLFWKTKKEDIDYWINVWDYFLLKWDRQRALETYREVLEKDSSNIKVWTKLRDFYKNEDDRKYQIFNYVVNVLEKRIFPYCPVSSEQNKAIKNLSDTGQYDKIRDIIFDIIINFDKKALLEDIVFNTSEDKILLESFLLQNSQIILNITTSEEFLKNWWKYFENESRWRIKLTIPENLKNSQIVNIIKECKEISNLEGDYLKDIKIQLELIIGKIYQIIEVQKDKKNFPQYNKGLDKYKQIYIDLFWENKNIENKQLYTQIKQELNADKKDRPQEKELLDFLDSINKDKDLNDLWQIEDFFVKSLRNKLYNIAIKKWESEIFNNLKTPEISDFKNNNDLFFIVPKEELDGISRKLKDVISIDSWQTKLSEAKKSWNNEIYQNLELSFATNLKNELIKYPYLNNGDNLRDIFNNKTTYCLLQSFLAHTFFEKVWIEHLAISLPDHSALLLKIWEREYYFDSTKNIIEEIKLEDKKIEWNITRIERLSKDSNFSYTSWEPDKILTSELISNNARMLLLNIKNYWNNSTYNTDYVLTVAQKSLEINPKNSYALEIIWEIYFLQNNYSKAVDYFYQAININPFISSFYSNIGKVYLTENKDLEAFGKFEKALSLKSSDTQWINWMIEYYFKINDLFNTEKYIKIWESKEEVDSDIFLRKYEFSMLKNDYSNALINIKNAINKKPYKLDYWLKLKEFYKNTSDFTKLNICDFVIMALKWDYWLDIISRLDILASKEKVEIKKLIKTNNFDKMKELVFRLIWEK